MENLDHVHQWQREGLVAKHDHQGRHDGQGQRHLDDDARPLAQLRLHAQLPVELADLGFHHVHADTATGHIGYLVLGGESGGENQVVALAVGQSIGSILFVDALFHRFPAQHIRIHTSTVVFDG